MALEQRLLNRSQEDGTGLDRLRRRVIFERIVARLEQADPGTWVLKGGMALEVRFEDDARLTKDIDLGLRGEVDGADELRDRLIDALSTDPDSDGFVLSVGPVRRLGSDHEGLPTWRMKVAASLADRPFSGIQLDVSPRTHELTDTDRLPLPNSLAFAGMTTPTVEIIDLHRHAAEKFHGMLKQFDDRENTRVRDLVDLVILLEQDALDPGAAATATRRVWEERDGTDPPWPFPDLPATWDAPYNRLATDHALTASTFVAAVGRVTALWGAMFRR